MATKMKAAIYSKFGPPDVLEIKNVEKPVPKQNEVLIKIYATTVEKEDPDMRKSPGLNGIFKPKNPILGLFLAGEIVEIGDNVTKFHIGDQIYGSASMKLGATAEYIALSEDSALVKKPANVTYEEAVSVLNGIITALPYLREKGNITSKHKILINGASGSVGTAAVQIAKYYDTEVTGVSSTRNIDLVKSIGADYAIDYTKEDFTKSDQKYDIIFDTVGKTSFSKCKSLLKSEGKFLTTVPSLGTLIQLLRSKILGNKKVKFTATGLRKPWKKIEDLKFANEMFEKGKLKPVIDEQYSLENIKDAHNYVATGHKRGSVVIKIQPY